MNVRVTFFLVVLLALVGGYVFLYELQRGSDGGPAVPWFYDVAMDDIVRIALTRQGTTFAFAQRAPGQWVFDDGTETPVNLDRWGGIPLLLTGPRSRRQVEERIDDPALYGLDAPDLRIGVTLADGRTLTVLVGRLTPDGDAHYARLEGYAQLFAITRSWGEVLSRLVTEPPYPTPTVEGAPTPEADVVF